MFKGFDKVILFLLDAMKFHGVLFIIYMYIYTSI